VPLTVLGEAVAEEDVSSMTNSYWVLNIARPEDDLSLDNILTFYIWIPNYAFKYSSHIVLRYALCI
jgi:hypothetical protein